MAKKKKKRPPHQSETLGGKPPPRRQSPPAIETQEPPIQTQDPPVETRGESRVKSDELPEAGRPTENSQLATRNSQPDEPAEEVIELRRQREILRGQAVTPFSKKKLSIVDRRIEELEKIVGALEESWHFWPEGEPMPEVHVKLTHKPTPCPNCRRRYLPSGGQAVTCRQSTSVEARFRCMYCKTTFVLPVRVVKV